MALSKAGSFGISLRYNTHARASRRIRKNAMLNMVLVHTVRVLTGTAARAQILAIRLRRKVFGFLVRVAGLDLKEVLACYGDGISALTVGKTLSSPISLSYALGSIYNFIAYVFHRAVQGIRRLSPSRVSVIAATAIAVIVIAAQGLFSIGLEVYINNYPIGYIDSAETYETAAKAAEQIASSQLGRPYTLKFQPEYRLTFVRKDYILEPIVLQNILYSNVKELRPMYVLSINGEIFGALSHREGLDELLGGMLGQAGGTGIRARFAQDVKIERKTTDITYFSTLESIREKLTGTTGVEKTYVVGKGDTLSQIASKNSMTVAELLSLNPTVDGDKIYIGEQLKVSATQSILSVLQTKTVEYTETIPFKTVEEKSQRMYTYESKIKVSGKNGTRKVVADVTYENGKEVGRVILSSTVVKSAVDKVVVKGTKKPPATAPTGTFMWPAKGNITSRYGPRWGGFHTGVDVANRRGTTVMAADGGTVTFARYSGSYGNLIKISHGNGVETYYAHNSSFLVKAGDKVAKGQPIAKMGSTGRSTGPHCHFEIRINGVTHNPLNYLP